MYGADIFNYTPNLIYPANYLTFSHLATVTKYYKTLGFGEKKRKLVVLLSNQGTLYIMQNVRVVPNCRYRWHWMDSVGNHAEPTDQAVSNQWSMAQDILWACLDIKFGTQIRDSKHCVTL
jgi:hypothetical protein